MPKDFDFTGWEAQGDLARRLGITAEALAAIRKKSLVQGEDWELDGRKALVSPQGASKVAAMLKVPEMAHKPAEEAVAERPVVELKVWMPAKNSRVVVAHKPEEKPVASALVMVRVRDNSNFTRGMLIPCWITVIPGVYDLARRCPRFKGRW